ncbi:hypothetical protein CDD81_4757 [Ophiocordyceps australis]|uniref:DJ-1/PfpI domain-containing protein n=1 Tax=Ophiocordyceps australis TaxID=1399860 RepID=A0A2C5Y9H4_9HYPO|nr:hypothetical protein CDD81_4757 [Ophiocordyceps australis]
MAHVVILMADYGGDPTETAVPYATFKKAGFGISFATETGKTPRCDARMMEGLTQLFLVSREYFYKLTMSKTRQGR